MIHYAKLKNSPRLQRLLKVLKRGRAYTTRELMYLADICAVGTAVAELRRNGFQIDCKCVSKGLFSYTLTEDQDPTVFL